MGFLDLRLLYSAKQYLTTQKRQFGSDTPTITTCFWEDIAFGWQ